MNEKWPIKKKTQQKLCHKGAFGDFEYKNVDINKIC